MKTYFVVGGADFINNHLIKLIANEEPDANISRGRFRTSTHPNDLDHIWPWRHRNGSCTTETCPYTRGEELPVVDKPYWP